MTDDEVLLERLSAAFSVAQVEPTPASIGALHDLVDDMPHTDLRHRVRLRRWTVPALVAGLVLSGSSVAYAVSPTVNRAARDLAHSIGLPVDSPNLDRTRRHRDELRAALDVGDQSVIAGAADRLRDDLRHLDDHERNQVDDAVSLLDEADQRQNGDADGPDDAAPESPGQPAADVDGNPSDAGGDHAGTPAPATGDGGDISQPGGADDTQPGDSASTEASQG